MRLRRRCSRCTGPRRKEISCAPSIAPLCCPYLAERRLWLLHACRRIIAVGGERIHALAEHDRIAALRIFGAKIGALEPTGEMIRHPGNALAYPFGHERLHANP